MCCVLYTPAGLYLKTPPKLSFTFQRHLVPHHKKATPLRSLPGDSSLSLSFTQFLYFSHSLPQLLSPCSPLCSRNEGPENLWSDFPPLFACDSGDKKFPSLWNPMSQVLGAVTTLPPTAIGLAYAFMGVWAMIVIFGIIRTLLRVWRYGLPHCFWALPPERMTLWTKRNTNEQWNAKCKVRQDHIFVIAQSTYFLNCSLFHWG